MNPDLIYEDMIEFPALKKFMEEMLVDYNATPGVVRMDLVLFKVRGRPNPASPVSTRSGGCNDGSDSLDADDVVVF